MVVKLFFVTTVTNRGRPMSWPKLYRERVGKSLHMSGFRIITTSLLGRPSPTCRVGCNTRSLATRIGVPNDTRGQGTCSKEDSRPSLLKTKVTSGRSAAAYIWTWCVVNDRWWNIRANRLVRLSRLPRKLQCIE